LDSVFNQTLSPHEVIVVNDGSTDNSLEILKSYLPRVRIISQTNKGVSVARNVGIRHCTGEWIAIQDADDIWDIEKLEKQWAAISSCDEEVVCCYTDFFVFGPGIERTVCVRPEHHQMKDSMAEMLADWSVTSNSALFRFDKCQDVFFPENIKDGEDIIFFAMLRKKGPFIRHAEPLAGYRKHPKQRTAEGIHEFQKLKSKLNWYSQNRILNPQEEKLFFQRLFENLNDMYERAYWRRDWNTLKACRRLYQENFKHLGYRKTNLNKMLPPKLAIQIKDCLYNLAKLRF
jgi:glycosyltransferase involved in cell wall biosynthesis